MRRPSNALASVVWRLQVLSVGSAAPVQDYKGMCDDTTVDNLSKATKQLQNRVDEMMKLYATLGGLLDSLIGSALHHLIEP